MLGLLKTMVTIIFKFWVVCVSNPGGRNPLTSVLIILGCGDFSMSSMTVLPDPCPLPEKKKKRSLSEKEKLIYAPMAGVGGIIYDKVRYFFLLFFFLGGGGGGVGFYNST